MNRYRCGKCSYVYDPMRGDPDGGIAPGTPFSRIPAGWRCPDCGASKDDFYVLSDETPDARSPRRSAPSARSDEAPSSSRSTTNPVHREWTVGSLKPPRTP